MSAPRSPCRPPRARRARPGLAAPLAPVHATILATILATVLATLLAGLVAVAAEAAAVEGDGARAEVRAALAARTTPTAVTRILRRLDRAFREARSGRGDLLEALLDVSAVPEGRKRLLAGPSPGALRAACANAVEWTGDPEAAAELLARLFEIERDEGRLLIAAFGPREADGSPSLPGAR
jgi:hypothetical protein